MSKINVPDEMLDAAINELGSKNFGNTLHVSLSGDLRWPGMEPILNQSLRWLVENGHTLLNDVQLKEISDEWESDKAHNGKHFYRWVIRESLRRMFLAPEEKSVPDGTVEYLTGTTRPVAIWWQNSRWPIQTITSENSDHKCPVDGALGSHKSLWGDLMPGYSESEEIKNLLFRPDVAEKDRTMTANERITEAFRRGFNKGAK